MGRHRRTLTKKGDVMSILLKFDQQGISVDPYTYVEVLKKVGKMKDLVVAKQVHDHVIQSKSEPNIYVLNTLLKVYIDCGSLVSAQQIFDKIVKKNVITWNIMIGGYAQHGHGDEAFRNFYQMQQEGLEPNPITFLSILNACSSPEALEQGKDLHTHIFNARLDSDPRVGTALVKMYAICGSLDNAQQVFDRMVNRNVISWTVMIGAYAERGYGNKAFELFLQMQREGLEPNAITYLSILNPCARTGGSNWVREVHAQALKAGLEVDVRVGNALISMYGKIDRVEDAWQVFNKMTTRDVISWNAMIGAYAESGDGTRAFQLFSQMQQEGLKPNAITYLSILNPRASSEALTWVRAVHAQALKCRPEVDVHVGNALINMYGKCGSIEDALRVFDKIATRDIISWNAMIGAYAESSYGIKAFELFLQMQREGLKPNAITYLNILNPRANAGNLNWVREVHAQALKAGLEVDVRVGNAFVNMYGKCGSIEDACRVFDRVTTRDVISWNGMIGACADSGYGEKSFELFLRMQREGVEPNAITFLSILNPCASAGALNWLREVHVQALKVGLGSDVRVGNALVNMYAKSGSIEDAWQVFDKMSTRDVISWNVMIGGLAQHGRGLDALQLFEQMKTHRFNPDEVTFVGVLSACSHAGLVDEGRRQFLSLSQDYDIVPTIKHYTCMVDILGRAGQLEEAETFIKDMPIEANATTWGALLGACRNHGTVGLAEHAAKQCLKLEPEDSSIYVLLSNIYAVAGMWDQVLLVRNMMKERGVRKEPGRSWIEVDKQVHSFVVEDRSHPQSEEIYAELERLTKHLKSSGYVPDTRLVVHNMNQQQKEDVLCYHSEKLAIAYGLISTPAEQPVRIFKNLRVCPDCHSATKFISKIVGREIIARDASRFHHFKDGMCSCGDYW